MCRPYLVVIVVLLASAGRAGEEPLTGRQIVERARREGEPHDEQIEIEMRLTPHGGRTATRKFRYDYLKGEDGLDCILIRFSYPRRMKGTGLLTLEQRSRNDDQWLYLPSLRRVRRIAADAKTERFVQSDFTYEDLQSEDLDDNAYKLLRTERVNDRQAYIVEAVPKSSSAYGRREIAIDGERWVRLRILYYDAEGSLMKTQNETGFRQHAGRFWRPDRIEMVDHQRQHTTVFAILGRRINEGVDSHHFTQRYLRSGL